jgi:hypothetical protein
MHFVFICVVLLDCFWNAMAQAQKPDFVFRRNGRVHLNRQGRQFSRLLAAEVCASAVVMLDTPCSEVVQEYWLPTPFASFPLHFPARASQCAITFQLDSTSGPIRSSRFLRRGYPGIAGLNTAESMDVYPLWLLRVMQVFIAGRFVDHVYTSSATLRAWYHLTQREQIYGHSLSPNSSET